MRLLEISLFSIRARIPRIKRSLFSIITVWTENRGREAFGVLNHGLWLIRGHLLILVRRIELLEGHPSLVIIVGLVGYILVVLRQLGDEGGG
jgi:hypothetical protein